MRKLIMVMLLCGSIYESPIQGVESREEVKGQGFYLKIGSGASFSTKADIETSPAVWDPAIQGYDSSLGTAPIVLAGLGYDSPFVSADIATSYRPNFTYRKFQTPTPGNTTGWALGQKTRKFDLDVTSLMFTLYFNGRGFNCLNWKMGKSSSIYPIVGGGVGASQLKIFNFRSTGLPSVVATYASFASENQYTIKYEFTYQLMGGFEYRYRDLFAVSTGYRF